MEAAVGAVRGYFTPAVVLLGLFGNVSIICIFCLEARLSRWNRFGVYCVALAVSDSSILFFNGLLDDFLGRGIAFASGNRTLVKLDTVSEFSCKLMEFAPHVFFFTSSYLLLAFTIDRLLTICQPLKFISHHHIRITVLLVIGIFALGLASMLPTWFIYELRQEDGVFEKKCAVITGNSSRLSCSMLYYKSFGVFVLPFAAELVLSCVIVYKLVRVGRSRKELLHSQPQESQLEMSRFYAQLTVSILYIIFVFPLCVVLLMRTRCEQKRRVSDDELLPQLSRLFDSIKDVNYAINFWVYLVFVRSFRRRCSLAVSYVFVKLRCHKLCPAFTISRKAVGMVDKLNRKRRPTMYVAGSLANARGNTASNSATHTVAASVPHN